MKYIFYDDCFLFLHDFLTISWLFWLIFLLLLFYRDYTTVGRLLTFFFGVETWQKWVGGVKISKIRHLGQNVVLAFLGPKQHHFGPSMSKIASFCPV